MEGWMECLGGGVNRMVCGGEVMWGWLVRLGLKG